MAPNGAYVKPFGTRTAMDAELSTLHGRLKYLRETVLGDMSYDELAGRIRKKLDDEAARTGASGSSIQRYETGQRQPRADYLRAMSDVAGVSVEWIVRGPDADKLAAVKERKAAAFDRLADVFRAEEADATEVAPAPLRTADEDQRGPTTGGACG